MDDWLAGEELVGEGVMGIHSRTDNIEIA